MMPKTYHLDPPDPWLGASDSTSRLFYGLPAESMGASPGRAS